MDKNYFFDERPSQNMKSMYIFARLFLNVLECSKIFAECITEGLQNVLQRAGMLEHLSEGSRMFWNIESSIKLAADSRIFYSISGCYWILQMNRECSEIFQNVLESSRKDNGLKCSSMLKNFPENRKFSRITHSVIESSRRFEDVLECFKKV